MPLENLKKTRHRKLLDVFFVRGRQLWYYFTHPAALHQRFFPKKLYEWRGMDAVGIRQKHYQSYDVYRKHQGEKLERIMHTWLPDYDVAYEKALHERLRTGGYIASGKSVLCLAARIGTEVRAFHSLGCFAIGIDLNPGKKNLLVLPGDFHHIQFPDHCVDVVFTNSIDHAFDLERLLNEIRRIMKPDGLCILEVGHGEGEGGGGAAYEAISWNTINDLLQIVTQHHFMVLARQPFTYPWPGEQIILRHEHSQS